MESVLETVWTIDKDGAGSLGNRRRHVSADTCPDFILVAIKTTADQINNNISCNFNDAGLKSFFSRRKRNGKVT